MRLLRIQQWLKNLFVFAPSFFSGNMLEAQVFSTSLLTFFCFSLAASSIYVLNDWRDRLEDAEHPEKRNRPLASGKLPATTGALLGFLSFGLSSLLSLVFLPLETSGLIFGYAVLNIVYTFLLKNYAILDVNSIAAGFVLRLFAGSSATGIELSSWIITLTYLLALFLALAKRRDDVLRKETGTHLVRKATTGYSRVFLDQAMTALVAVVIVAYLQYCHALDRKLSVSNEYLYLTSIFVIVGVLRYLQLTLVYENTANPTQVLATDRFTQLNLLLWGGTYFWLLY